MTIVGAALAVSRLDHHRSRLPPAISEGDVKPFAEAKCLAFHVKR
jgi:hypothetical protein